MALYTINRMSIYLIVVTDGTEGVLETVRDQWPDHHYAIKDDLIMISAQGISAPSQIAQKVGIAIGADCSSGVVLSMNYANASGVLPRTAVDWYKAAKDD